MRRSEAGSLLIALILIFAALAGVLVFLLVKSAPFSGTGDAPSYASPTGLQFAASDSTYAPLTLGATATPEPSSAISVATPTPVPVPPDTQSSAAPETADAASTNRFMPTPPPGDFFLPVIDHALRTPDDQAMIAITLDGCDDAVKMTTVLNLAARYDAELTLFPTGDALMKLGPGFRTCVNVMGFEVENCTYDTDKKDYSLSTGELALQIWRQSLAASYAMERDYQEHFYRPSLKESAGDQRTHFFIRKLGFTAVVTYTHSAKGSDLAELANSLANGNIYQFDMSDASMALLESFMSEANRKGYKMVTLNELMGLNTNEQGRALTLEQQTLPAIDDYTPTYYDLKLNDRSNAVYTLQARLIGLGYLTAEPGKSMVADGIYGGATSIAVSKFQARVGLIATGNADVATQQALFAEDAPVA